MSLSLENIYPSNPQKFRESVTVTAASDSFRSIRESNFQFPESCTKHTSSTIFDINELQYDNMYCNYRSHLTVEDFTHTQHFTDGTHSNIFKARMVNKPVILKVMKDNIQVNEVAYEEFIRETIITSCIRHKNIVQSFGCGEVPSILTSIMRPLIALEVLDGGSLAARIEKSRNGQHFSYVSKLLAAKELAEALHYLHEQVHRNCILIHRDLKPVRQNIFFFVFIKLLLAYYTLHSMINKNRIT